MTTIKRLIFIRPGETDWNQSGRWQGWVNAPLNAHGRRQAMALANVVRHIGMSALFSSDLKRAAETAELIAAQLGFAPTFDARLRERNVGLWQGLTLDEIRAWNGDEYTQLLADVDGFRVPGGESRADVRTRVMSALNEVLSAGAGETVGILSHTTATKIMLEQLIPGYNARGVDLDNTSVTTIHRADTNDRWQAVAVDDVLHLEGLESRSFGELEDEQS